MSEVEGNMEEAEEALDEVFEMEQEEHDEIFRYETSDYQDSLSSAAEKDPSALNKYGSIPSGIDEAMERKLRLKIDLFTVPVVSILYLFTFIDRANIGNAVLADLEKDLGLQGYDFNVVLTSFYISYIVFEIPATLVCKLIGPGWFLPAASLGFGAVSLATAATHNMAQLCGVRFLLGVLEAGLLPGIAYYLSRWYRRSELAFRLSLYIVMAPLAGAFGGLLASAILESKQVGIFTGWRKIFAVEGIITMGLSVIAFFLLTDRPETARWLSEEEKMLAIERVKRERVGTTVVLDKIDKPKILRGIFNPVTLTTSFIFLLNNVTVQGISLFLPTIVATLYPEESHISQQLHTVPPYVVGAFLTVLLPLVSWFVDRRVIFYIASSPVAIVGYIMFLASTEPHVRYAATFLIAGGSFPFGALCNAHISANVVSDTARSVAIGTNVMFGNIGGLISTWSYLRSNAPKYTIGSGLNLATSSVILMVSVALWFWIRASNQIREQIDVDAELAGLTDQQVEDLDWKHPAFRWKQ